MGVVSRKEGRDKFNEYSRSDPTRKRGRAGAFEWVDKRERGEFTLPSSARPDSTGSGPRSTRARPFRWMVQDNGSKAKWKGGFSTVRKVWDEAGP